jgi:hypothetical protein
MARDYHAYDYPIPPEIQRLQIPLLRAHRYPRDPAYVAEAAQEYLDGAEKPIYMPQKMGFMRWKTPPYERSFRSAVGSPVHALAQEESRWMGVVPAHWMMPEDVAVSQMDADRLPPTNFDPSVNEEPVARGALPLRNTVTADDLSALVRSVGRNTLVRHVRKNLGREVARETVRGLQALYDDEVSEY